MGKTFRRGGKEAKHRKMNSKKERREYAKVRNDRRLPWDKEDSEDNRR